MKSSRVLLKLTLLTMLAMLTGCNGGSAEFEYPEATQKVSQLQSFRSTVKVYADSGQLDSGAELLVEEVDQLADAGVTNVAEVKAKVQELVASKSPAETKKIANEILGMLPAADAAPAAE